MNIFLFDKDGAGHKSPELLKWSFEHGFCSPCDSFELEFAYSPEMHDTLCRAVMLKAVFDGKTVFYGVVDEFEAGVDKKGMTVCVRGRGLQALLLDNEAESAEYFGTGLDTILSTFVSPNGIKSIDRGTASAARADISVSSGESCWSVLSRFLSFCSDGVPRFSREGTLLLDGMSGGTVFRVDGKTAVCSQSCRQNRYGAISRAVVKSRVYGTRTVIDNDELIALGASCRRVIQVPRKTGYDAMRYTGSYQIKKSMEDFYSCSLTLAEPFAAFAGDRVHMTASPLGISGEFIVWQSRCTADGGGCVTRLDLKRL